jgi:hypothetical protein
MSVQKPPECLACAAIGVNQIVFGVEFPVRFHDALLFDNYSQIVSVLNLNIYYFDIHYHLHTQYPTYNLQLTTYNLQLTTYNLRLPPSQGKEGELRSKRSSPGGLNIVQERDRLGGDIQLPDSLHTGIPYKNTICIVTAKTRGVLLADHVQHIHHGARRHAA